MSDNQSRPAAALATAVVSMEGDIRTARDLLDAAILLLEPSPDGLGAYEGNAIFSVVSASRNSVYAVIEQWERAFELTNAVKRQVSARPKGA